MALQALGRESLSYLYIQGDKQTPFYVKLEEAMQPRYGKNYCIVPQLAPGPAHIEILFQQNAFPAQQFTVLIPEQGSRGFLLVKKDDGFSLYDLQQGFYLPAGNSEADDKLPAIGKPVAQPPVAIRPPAAESIVTRTNAEPQTQKPVTQREPGKPATTPEPVADAGKPAFIPNMELSKPGSAQPDMPPAATTSALPVITNSDCPAPVSGAEFGKIFSAMSAYDNDEDRLGFMIGKLDVCYESWQARTLAGRFDADAARYALLKRLYPRITDQSAFPLLDDLLTSATWKAEFARLVHH